MKRKVIILAVILAMALFGGTQAMAAAEFPDVDESANYYKSVVWASDNGIVNGYSNGYFGPEDSCTREQFVVMIWRLAGRPATDAEVRFSDVSTGRSTYRAMQWAVGRGIIKGFSDGSFRPEATVTRAQVAIMLWRMAGEPKADAGTAFTDVSSTGTINSAIGWGSETGLVRGFGDGTFRPDQNCLRQQIVIFLYRYARDVMREEEQPSGEPATEEPEQPTEPVLPEEPQTPETGEMQPAEERLIYASNGSQTITIKPEDNSSAVAFIELLRQGDVTVDMHDYGSFEKVGPLGSTLPRNDEQITTEPGDVILYLGNQITIYYAQNTWNFTRLGKVQNMTQEELKAFLGDGNVTVTFSVKR